MSAEVPSDADDVAEVSRPQPFPRLISAAMLWWSYVHLCDIHSIPSTAKGMRFVTHPFRFGVCGARLIHLLKVVSLRNGCAAFAPVLLFLSFVRLRCYEVTVLVRYLLTNERASIP